MEFLFILVLVRVFLGAITALIASKKGRSTVGWFFGGFFLDIIAIIIVAVLPNLKEQRAHRMRTENERRRLREQLRQERFKNEAFRQYSAQRIDTHDQVLGLDTRPAQAALPGGPAAQPLPTGGAFPAPPPPPEAQPVWYYETRGASAGPVSQLAIQELLRDGRVNPATLVWTEGLGDWTALRDVDVFRGGARR